jgi:hypothetical protein
VEFALGVFFGLPVFKADAAPEEFVVGEVVEVAREEGDFVAELGDADEFEDAEHEFGWDAGEVVDLETRTCGSR